LVVNPTPPRHGASRPGHRRSGSLGRTLLAPLALLAVIGGCAGAVRFLPGLVDSVIHHPYFAVQQIVLHGAQALSHDAVLRQAGLRAGMSIWDIGPSVTEERIEELAWVQRARVRREFPNRVVVSVTERAPFAIAVVEGLQYLDRSGRVLGPVRAGAPIDLPFITGIKGTHLDGTGVPQLRRALRFIRLCEKRVCAGGVSEVHLDPVNGLVLVPRDAAVPVLLGWGRWNGKLDRLERVLSAWEGQEGRIGSIDLTLGRSVVVKLREGEPKVPATGKAGGMPI
jgi:cell division protein FtsQ